MGVILLLVAALLVVVGIALRSGRGGDKAADQETVPVGAVAEAAPPETTRTSAPPQIVQAEGSPEADSGFPRLPRAKVEDYLQRNQRNARSLLAAFHTLNDTNYLREAATNFPGDPQVQWTILARNAFPEERRRWLDAFKTSSPGNSLANYLSATQYFKDGQPDAAVKELVDASAKTGFKDFAMDARLDEEALSRDGGMTLLMSVHVSGWSEDLLGELGEFKGLGNGIVNLRKQYAEAGDADSAQHLIQMGTMLADRFENGDGAKFLLSQMIGNALEGMMLKQLDPNTPYAFLDGKTPAQRSEEILQRKAEVRELSQVLSGIYGNSTEAEIVMFVERMNIYGEAEALRWMQQRQKAAANPGN